MDKPGLVIISRQALWRHALACLLKSRTQYVTVREYNGTGEISLEAKNTGSLIYFVDAELPDVQIGDIVNMSGNGHNKVIIFGSSYYKERLIELMPLKADGYLATDLSGEEFVVFLEKVRQGGPVIADSLIPELVNRLSDISGERTDEKKAYSTLTPREKEILKLLAAGNTNGQIAKKLVISVYTVKNHVHKILEKMEITNRAQLVSYALTSGLVSGLVLLLAAAAVMAAVKPSLC